MVAWPSSEVPHISSFRCCRPELVTCVPQRRGVPGGVARPCAQSRRAVRPRWTRGLLPRVPPHVWLAALRTLGEGDRLLSWYPEDHLHSGTRSQQHLWPSQTSATRCTCVRATRAPSERVSSVPAAHWRARNTHTSVTLFRWSCIYKNRWQAGFGLRAGVRRPFVQRVGSPALS